MAPHSTWSRPIRTPAPLLLVALTVALLAPDGARAQTQDVPRTMTFQGRLVRTDGAPEETEQALSFALYEAASGGVALWTESHPSVPVTNGFYSVRLGSRTPLREELLQRGTLFLGVSIAGQSELTPRVELASVPFALRAADSRLLDGRPAAAFAVAGHGHPDATPTAAGFLSAADKAKLDAPATTYGDGLTASGSPLRVSVSFPGTGGTNGTSTTAARANHSHAAATPTSAGFLSTADKTKLDAVPTAYGDGLSLATGTLSVSYAGTGGTHGTAATAARSNHSHAPATPTAAGFLSDADKAKLDTLAAPADGLAVSGSPARLRVSFAAAGPTTGTAVTAARSDHTHALSCLQRSGTSNEPDTLVSVVWCAANEVLTGGGCQDPDTEETSMPVGSNTAPSASPPGSQGWRCRSSFLTGTQRPTAYAICCRLP